MARIYTKTGDDGTTGLFGGKRLSKHSARVEAYGTVDELNSFIGQAIAQGISEDTAAKLLHIQEDLFFIGSVLADVEAQNLKAKPELIKSLEDWIDQFTDQLPPLKAFVLPGGSMAASTMHVARTVCRRAERTVAMLCEDESIPSFVLPYLNRLSDLLFVMARFQNQQEGRDDIKWNPER